MIEIDRVGGQAGKTRCIPGMQDFAALVQQADGGARARYPQLAPGIGQVPLDRRLGDAQLGRDLIGLPVLRDTREATAFLGSQEIEQGHHARSDRFAKNRSG